MTKDIKNLFANKGMFLEFLQSFVNENWVKGINEEDLVRIDKEFILQDYRKKEADIAYRMKLINSETGEEQQVIFYILLELQSSIDRIMPYRLLMYMVQIWKQELMNIEYSKAQENHYKLPSIVPIVLYNGEQDWDVPMKFKDLQAQSERFGNHLVNFQYILVDVNYYSEQELLKLSNAISCIIMMDQKSTLKDKESLTRKLNEIVKMKDKLPKEKMELIFEWLIEVFSKRITEGEEKTIIENLKEGKCMEYAIERFLDKIALEAAEKAAAEATAMTAEKVRKEEREKSKKEIMEIMMATAREKEKAEKDKVQRARVALIKNIPKELVAEITGLDIEKVEALEKEIIH